MRILHTIPGRNWGGMEQRVFEQVRWLAAHGHAVCLLAPGDGEPFRKAQKAGLPVEPFDFDRPWAPATIAAFRSAVRRFAPEIIDTHVTRDAKAALCCLDLAAVVRSRHVNQPLKSTLIRRLQWRWGADHIITVAGCTRDDLIAHGLADPRRSTAIGGWADDSFFTLADPAATRVRVRAELGLPADATVLISVGMLRPDKGQQYAIRALELLGPGSGEPYLLVVGAPTEGMGGYEEQLKSQAAAAGLGERVRFTGFRDDIANLMQAADLAIIPSLTEAQPRVAVQAFAAGRPVVASAVGGLPEIVKEGVTGWLVPPGDAQALADAIARVLADANVRQRVAEAGRRVAEETMRIDRVMEMTLQTYAAALASARRRRFPRLRRDGKEQG